MELQKNDLVTVKIEDMSHDGEGVGKLEGFPLFVKDTVIGDVAEVKILKLKKNYGYARLTELKEPSPDRVEPPCPLSRRCGGCQLQAMSYEKQLEFKRNKVQNHLSRIGGLTDVVVLPVIGMESPWRYRNKAQIPVGYDREGRLISGFYAGRTHAIIDQEDCLLGNEKNSRIMEIVKGFLKENKIAAYQEESHKGLLRHVLIRTAAATGEVMVCLVINGKKFPQAEKLTEALKAVPGVTSISLNVNMERTNVILGKEQINLYGPGYITDKIGEISYRISPQSFFQVNPAQTRILYETALEYAQLTGSEQVWDLYCGTGTISLFLAQKAAFVRGVEIVPAAVENARDNAELNGIKNAEFFTGRAEEVLPRMVRENQAKADVIVVDPPRKGCEESLLETMVNMEPERIVYVSCDSATLARDLKYLSAKGYAVERVQPVDMFPMTVGVETVVLLSKGEVDSKKIRVEFSLEDMDMSEFQDGATYTQIKDYVLEHSGLKVSNLYISQIKRKCGIEVGKNYNLPKSEDSRQPQCPPEKEKAIREAFKYFGMI